MSTSPFSYSSGSYSDSSFEAKARGGGGGGPTSSSSSSLTWPPFSGGKEEGPAVTVTGFSSLADSGVITYEIIRIENQRHDENDEITWLRLFLSNLAGSSFFFWVGLPNPEIPMAAKTSMSAIVAGNGW